MAYKQHRDLPHLGVKHFLLFSSSECPTYCPVTLVCFAVVCAPLPCLCGCCCWGQGSCRKPLTSSFTATSPCPLQDVCRTWLTGDRLRLVFTWHHMLHTRAANIIWAILEQSPAHPLLSCPFFSPLPIAQCSRFLLLLLVSDTMSSGITSVH